MKFWKQLRIPFLALVGGSVFLALGKIILFPSPPYAPPLAFPEAVPLSGWQLVDSRPLNPRPADKQLDLVAGRYYRYRQGNRLLEIEMRYLLSGRDVRALLNPAALPSLEERQKADTGSYGLGTEQSRAYLSSCIKPYSGATNRLLPWLLGTEPLRDSRCLWVHLSLPLKDASPDTAYSVLENVWLSWYKWWEPRFQKN